MKLPCQSVPEEVCLNNLCAECHKLLKTIEEPLPISVQTKAIA